MKLRYLPSLLLLIFAASCSFDNPYIEDIKGEWECVSWMAEGKDKVKDSNTKVEFSFGQTDHYSSSLNGAKTEGVYRIVENKLYTKASDDPYEIMVKITSLNEDELSFEMNRAGEKETMKFKKSK